MSDDLKGIGFLRKKLAVKRDRVRTRYEYYEMKRKFDQRGITIPPEIRVQYRATLGWCTKAVDSIADRLQFREFENDNFEMNEIFNMNNPDVLFDSAILSALISSCCFIYISPDESGFPRLIVIEGGDATGVIDEVTGLLKEGYAVLDRDKETNAPLVEAYFTPDQTVYYESGKETQVTAHKAGHPLLVPIIYRPDAKRPFGHSRISRTCMYIQKYACRTLERSDVASEFYSYPQRYVVGRSIDSEELNTWKATITSMLDITKDESGDKPTLGQFTQQSMTPYTDQLRMAAALFAGETGLTLDDLGFATENPSSAEAIKASHENLRAAARKAQRSFGSGFLNAGYLAACLRDNFPYKRKQIYLTNAKWEPIFEPDVSTLSGVGDALIKIEQGFPGYMTEDKIRDLTGF